MRDWGGKAAKGLEGVGARARAAGGTPGKRTRTEGLERRATAPEPEPGGDELPHGGDPPIVLFGVTLRADMSGDEFHALELAVPEDKRRLLRWAAKRGTDVVAALLQDLVPDGLSLGQIRLLRGIAVRYVTWVATPALRDCEDARLEWVKTKYGDGYKYGGKAAEDYQTATSTPGLLDEYLLSGERDKQLAIYKFVMETEGGSSAINAYDGEILTLGPGFSGQANRAGSLYQRMPEQFHARLQEHGIVVNEDGSFTVTECDGTVVTGDEALRLLARDEIRLSLLISLAESTEKMGEWTAREWMIREQFGAIIGSLKPYWARIKGWDEGVLKLAYKMYHWLPGVASWEAMIDWTNNGGALGPNGMFRKVRAAIVARFPNDPDFTDEAVKGVMQKRAKGAGVNLGWTD